eukprot:3684007-Prymnesium_polylepis.1
MYSLAHRLCAGLGTTARADCGQPVARPADVFTTAGPSHPEPRLAPPPSSGYPADIPPRD